MSLIQNYGDKMAQAFALGLDVDFRGARAALISGIEDLIKAEKELDHAAAWSVESYQPPPLPEELQTLRSTVAALRVKIGLSQG
jgi:hypothetical protein